MRRALLIVVALGFALGLSYPYLGLDPGDSRIEVPGGLQYAVLVTHIFAAAVALVLGPLQLLRQTKGRRHRTLGRVYLLAGVLPAAVAAVPVALWSGRLLTQVGLITAAVLWLVTGGLAYRAARRRDFAAHRAWMLRNYALTFLAVTARVLVPFLLLVRIPFGGADPARVPELIPIGQTLGWIVNLALVELFIVRRTARSRTRPPPLPPPP
ncbi:DUF2306 domain-containing protein [Dactylosporangium sp. NPDC049140]|uniref:DUF2306 domain-containing protein n=1 Tax=Dactylosporangium sp. NPDC049140 TaxID=3155647 RepID=UPI0033D82B9E